MEKSDGAWTLLKGKFYSLKTTKRYIKNGYPKCPQIAV